MEDELISETGKDNKYCLAHEGQKKKKKKKKKKTVYKELIHWIPARGAGIS
jgi:hypothetical protein